MSNSYLSAFALIAAVGVGVACLPRALAPSNTYISDSLGLNQDFYFTAEPDSMTVNAGDRTTFIVATNIIEDVLYQWQVSDDTGVSWTDLETLGADHDIFRFTSSAADDGLFYRCMATHGDSIIYTAPILLSVLLEEVQTTTTQETTIEEVTTTETQGGVIYE